jgi:antitoxin (DNA-binding transcriptional repressor) of toxin-antitoxin stability system
VENGLEILIARGKKPVARLVPLKEKPVAQRPNVGEMIDKPFHIPDTAFASLSAKELAEFLFLPFPIRSANAPVPPVYPC